MPLVCGIDSVTVCPGADPIVVTIDGQPIDVNITGGGGGDGGFTPVAGSRWLDTDADTLSLLGTDTLTLTSPVPAAGQRVVVDSLSYFAEVAVGLSLTAVQVRIEQVSDNLVLWQGTLGFTATAGLGATSTFETTDITVFGGLGEQLQMVIEIGTGLGVSLASSANFEGYLASN